MDDPEADEASKQFLHKTEQARRNRLRFLIVLARFKEACEAREERQSRSNPWTFSQVMEN